ncbi:MAG: tyrosine-type recombinase/integrase [Lachnospiraceae bacterium]|nr:tyrosine-type recombinase/integrase [Lachnospiraceae bacterium]
MEPKTKAGIRDIPMIDQGYDALKAEYKVQQERGFPTPAISGMTGFIFVNEEGRLRSLEAINRAIDTITRCCNKEEEQKAQEENREPIIIPHFSCHVFRHAFCENETNTKVIQEIMGHANISITMDIYAKATEEKKKQALDELSKNLKIF